MHADRTSGILLVDDEPRSLRLYRRILGNIRHEVKSCENAAEALRLLEEDENIDVVVTDLLMPAESGIRLLEAIRERFADRPWLQVIMVTGHATLESAVAAVRLQATEYLLKPLTPKKLSDAVTAAIERAAKRRRMQQEAEALQAPENPMLQGMIMEAHKLSEKLELLSRSLTGMDPGQVADMVPAAAQMSRVALEQHELRVLQLLEQLEEIRNLAFNGAVLPDPSWQMLAELVRARITNRHVSVTSLCLASKAPVTTGLRRLEELAAAGFILRVPDKADRRRNYVELSSEGLMRMYHVLQAFENSLKEHTAAPVRDKPAEATRYDQIGSR